MSSLSHASIGEIVAELQRRKIAFCLCVGGPADEKVYGDVATAQKPGRLAVALCDGI